jgi:hypothetical protein
MSDLRPKRHAGSGKTRLVMKSEFLSQRLLLSLQCSIMDVTRRPTGSGGVSAFSDSQLAPLCGPA